MSLFDDLMGRLKQTGDAVKAEASKRATQAAIDQLKGRVAAAADGLLGGMEEDLEKARAAREGRPSHAPSAEDPVADQIIAQARDRSAASPAPAKPSYAEQKAARRAKAAAELAAIKARMGKTDAD